MSTSATILKNKYGFEYPFKSDPLTGKALRYLKNGKKLLDVGCGEGADSVFFAKKGFQVTAMDSNKIYLSRLRAFITDNEFTNISIKYGDVIDYHYRQSFYDVINCLLVGCCMKRSDFEKMKGEKNKKAIQKIVNTGKPVGVIGYINAEPVAWCAVAPREKFLRLETSRVLKKIDDQPVWSVTCFFINKKFRRKGLSVEMLKGVIEYCRNQKVKIIEAYPSELKKDLPDVFVWTGITSSFIKAGFKEAARNSETRPIMRYYL